MKKSNNVTVVKIVFFTSLYALLILLINTKKIKAEEIINNGTYTIKSAINTEYVLDITGASNQNCANVELWSNNNGTNQKFNIKSIGNGYYTISSLNSGKYLDVEGAKKASGANVLQYQYNGGDNQKWLIKSAGNGYYYIISKCNNLYLDVANSEMKNGTNIITWQYNGGTNQKFILELQESENISSGTYKIVSAKNSNYVLDVTGAAYSNGANIELWDDNNKNNQKFNIKNEGNGYYTITAVSSGKYLDVEEAKKTNGANVLQYEYNGADNQKWLIKSAGEGYYYIISKCNGLYLDVSGGIMQNGTNIITWEYNGGYNQKFKLIQTTALTNINGKSGAFKLQYPNIKIGIDVSKYQENINWNAVKNDGIDYVMIRARI